MNNREDPFEFFSWEWLLAGEAKSLLHQVRDFAADTENLIEKHAVERWTDALAALQKAAHEQGWDDREYEGWEQSLWEDHHNRFEIGVPKIFRYAVASLLHTAIEYGIRTIAIHEAERLKTPFRPDELRGAPLERYKLFLSRSCNIDFGTIAEWENITILQKVRDCIVHCAGFLDQSADAKFLRSLAERDSSGISLSEEFIWEGAVLEVGPKFITDSLDSASGLFDELIKRLSTEAAPTS